MWCLGMLGCGNLYLTCFGKDWNRDTLLGALENTLAADGLRDTLSHAKRNSSRISALLRQKFIDCIRPAATQQSLSIDYVVPP